jgi:hypothetical protein
MTELPSSINPNEPNLDPPIRPMTRKERVHALRGKFAHVPFSSDDHIRQKQEEKELEDGHRE